MLSFANTTFSCCSLSLSGTAKLYAAPKVGKISLPRKIQIYFLLQLHEEH
jgi:hypothetical protein